MKTELKTIDSTSLETVTGGTMPMPMPPTKTPGGSTSSSGSSSSNDALMTSLNSIGDSIKGLSHKNNGLFGGDNAMMFMMMGLAFSRRSEVVVNYGGHGGGGGYGFHYRAWG